MYERNLECIKERTGTGLEMLRANYEVKPVEVKEELRKFKVAGRTHVIEQYEIVGVGNLVVMSNPEEGPMQMDTFTLTPYFKNLPLFTTDYMYFEDKRMWLNEIYSLVGYEDELYKKYISEFADNCDKYRYLPEMKIQEAWYDSIRPVVIGRTTTPEQDKESFELFYKNLETFIKMEKESPLLDEAQLKVKWTKNYEYARALVEDGGVSTKLFVDSIGAELTKHFFYSVFFGPDRYKRG